MMEANFGISLHPIQRSLTLDAKRSIDLKNWVGLGLGLETR